MNDSNQKLAQSPWWDSDLVAHKLSGLKNRNIISAALREWFIEHEFTEVETSYLQLSPGLEPHLTAFETKFIEPFEEDGKTLFLHTSPEYAMKKLLVGGMDKIFQFARCFRNCERSAIHHPEFTMLEWYQTSESFSEGALSAEKLIKIAANTVGVDTIQRNEKNCDLTKEFCWLTVQHAFDLYAAIDLRATLEDPLYPNAVLFERLAVEAGVRVAEDDDWTAIFDRIFLEKIEPNLGLEVPTILYNWPLPLAALAKPLKHDYCFCERFEIYVAGIELANGFGELTDAREQRRRFEAEQNIKRKMAIKPYPIDEEFLTALEIGLPESAGVAMGFDRLVMLLTGAEEIQDVIWCPMK